MKFLIDMNLSPALCRIMEAEGWNAEHWSEVGNSAAEDDVIMDWARNSGRIIITHDLDFGTLLAVTNADGPSVIQVRTQNVMPDFLEPILVSALKQFESELRNGALIVLDEGKQRARILPLNTS